MTNKVDLDELQDILNGHRYEHYVHSKCPFHQDSRPSFFVYEDRYHCASCSRTGFTKDLLKKLGHSGIIPSYSNTDTIDNPFRRWLKSKSLASILRCAWINLPSVYLRERGIPDAVQKRLGLGIMEDWITFPIRDESYKIVGAVARAGKSIKTQAKYIIPPGQNPNLLYVPDWKLLQKSEEIFIVFGIIDAVTLAMLNIPCISTTTGLQLDHTVLDKFRKKIIFIPDIGEEEKAHKMAHKLGWRGSVMRFPYPDGTKDINEVYLKRPDIIMFTLCGDQND